MLIAIGDWMQVNGEAIYDTHVGGTFGEGPTKVQDGGFSDGVKKNFTARISAFTAREIRSSTALKAKRQRRIPYLPLRMYELIPPVGVYHGLIESVSVLGTGDVPGRGRALPKTGCRYQTNIRPIKPDHIQD